MSTTEEARTPGQVMLPLDDPSRPLNDSALPSVMVWAGGEAYDELTLPGTADRALDLDSCALAVGIYRAMTEAHAKEIATLSPASAAPRTDSAERTAGGWRKVMRDLIAEHDKNVCPHEETHRGGAIWTIRDHCGRKWADDEGGFQPYEEPAAVTAAWALLKCEEVSTPAPSSPGVPDSVRSLSEAYARAVEERDRADTAHQKAVDAFEADDPAASSKEMNASRQAMIEAHRAVNTTKHDLAEAARTLLSTHPAGQSTGQGAEDFSGKFWLHLKESRCVPERKGPFRSRDLAKTLREFMAARPQAYISVVTVSHDGLDFEDGPQALQATDGRSMSTGSKHIQRVRAAHGDHADLPAPDSTRTGQVGTSARELIPFKANYRHKKTGGLYQTLDVVTNGTNGETNGQKMVLYTNGMKSFVREYSEFSDGRFERNQPSAALAARPAAPEAQGAWRPISTAPRDGSYVLGYGPHESRGSYVDAISYWNDGWPIRFMHGFGEPTHWMPLPAPPSSGQGGR